jgi:membrane associated rhomboid family serine protease/TolA-binding protein
MIAAQSRQFRPARATKHDYHPAVIIPLGTDRPLRHRPVVTTTLIGLNILVAIAMVAISASNPNLADRITDAAALDPSGARPLSFISYTFLHGGFWHLFGNMIVLWAFGPNLEDRLRWFGFLAFYIASGIIAGLAHALISGAPCVGASGAVAGVTGASIILFPRTNVRCFLIFIFVGIYMIPAWWFIGFGVFKDIFLTATGRAGNVATWAHLGGYASGALAMVILRLTGLLKMEDYDLLALIRQRRRRREIEQAVRANDIALRHRTETALSPEDQAWAARRAAITNSLSAGNAIDAGRAWAALARDAAASPGADAERRPVALSPRQQLDVANALFAAGEHASAASAYDTYATAYPREGETPRALLMLALIAARHLAQPTRAVQALSRVPSRFTDPSLDQLATELARECAQGKSADAPSAPQTRT